MLSETFGVEASECDRVLRSWSQQTNTPLPHLADVLINQIWHGHAISEDRALVRFLENRLRQLPADRSRDELPGPEQVQGSTRPARIA
jgi:hypothetical protein